MTVVRLIAAAARERKAEREVEERHEEDAAADTEQRAEAAGNGAGDEDDRASAGVTTGIRNETPEVRSPESVRSAVTSRPASDHPTGTFESVRR